MSNLGSQNTFDTSYNPGTNTTSVRHNGQTVASYQGSTIATTSTAYAGYQYSYTPTSAGMYTQLGSGFGVPTWSPGPTYPVQAPFKGQVINWGGKVYYQPSDKMRALVDALRLV